MDVDRFEGVQSAIAGRTELASEPGAAAVPFEAVEGVGGVVGITGESGTTLLVAAVGAAVLLAAAAGALVAYRRRNAGSLGGPSGSARGDGPSGGVGGATAASDPALSVPTSAFS